MAFRQFLEGLAKVDFGLPVQTAGRFIQKQNRRIAHQGTGNGDALALPARKSLTGLADIAGVAVRLIDNEFMNTSRFCGDYDFVIRGFGNPVGDVVADRSGQQYALLGHIAHPCRQLGARELADVGAVQKNSST